mgnify:CR=1 FL=1
MVRLSYGKALFIAEYQQYFFTISCEKYNIIGEKTYKKAQKLVVFSYFFSHVL